MNKKLGIGVGLVLMAANQGATAGGTYIGMVRPVHYGSLYLEVSATQMASRPACATRSYVQLLEDPSTNVYKSKFAMILSAWLAEKPLSLVGTGTCTSEGDEIIYVVTYP